jgi:hypothetical protein
LITVNSSNTTNNIHSNKVLKEDYTSIASGNISQKISIKGNLNLNKSNKKENLNMKEVVKYVEEELLTIKNTITPYEFLNSVKAGFELALCIYILNIIFFFIKIKI